MALSQEPLRISILGQQFRNHPPIFDRIKQDFPQVIDHWGFIADRQEYLSILKASDFVLSTSDHDFQGLSILEATALGCIPIIPNDLVYPEYFLDRFLYNRGPNVETTARNALQKIQQARIQGFTAPAVDKFERNKLKKNYKEWLSL